MIANEKEFDRFKKYIDKKVFFIVSFFIGCFFSWFFQDSSLMLLAWVISYLIIEPIMMMFHFSYIFIMHNISNRTEKIEENGKIYTVKFFDINNIVKYYYQGKLHREKGYRQ